MDNIDNSFEKVCLFKDKTAEGNLEGFRNNEQINKKKNILIGEIGNNIDNFTKEYKVFFFENIFRNIFEEMEKLLEEKNDKKNNIHTNYNPQIKDLEILLGSGK